MPREVEAKYCGCLGQSRDRWGVCMNSECLLLTADSTLGSHRLAGRPATTYRTYHPSGRAANRVRSLPAVDSGTVENKVGTITTPEVQQASNPPNQTYFSSVA